MSRENSSDPDSVNDLLERTLKANDIPPRPLIIDRIRGAMSQAIPNLRVVGQLISADVGLAAGLIKTANSPYFGFRGRVSSVREALLILGLEVSSRAVAAICLRRAFPDSGQYERFWDSSARIAALSGWLAQRVQHGKLRPDAAYTFGLFRDVGIVILLRRFPGAYLQTLAHANAACEHPFTEIERQDFPADHAMIGKLLAQHWWLPDDICRGIRHHHELSALDPFDSELPLAGRYLIAVSQTAEHILQQLTGASRTEEWRKLGEACLRLLDLEQTLLDELYKEGEDVLRSVD